jgi:hypothetical protein
MENGAIARVLNEIADLLEIKGDNPFKIRAYRTGPTRWPAQRSRLADLPEADLLALPGIGRDLARRVRELVETGDTPFHRQLLAEFPRPSSTCCGCRASVRRPSGCSTRSSASARWTTSRRPPATGGSPAIRGMGAKKQALILKAIEERRRFGRAPPAARHARHGRRVRRAPPRARPRGRFRARWQPAPRLRDLRRHRHPRRRRHARGDGRVHLLPAGGPRARPRRDEEQRAAAGRRAGRPAPGAAGESRRLHAVLHRLEGPQHRAARSGDPPRLQAERVRALRERRAPGGRRHRGVHLRGARARVDSARTPRAPRRARGRCGRRAPAARSSAPTSAATSTCTPRRPTAATTSRPWRSRRGRPGSSTSPSPITARRSPWPTASTSDAPSRTRSASATSAGVSRASRCSPASSATSAPTGRSTSPTTASPRSTTSWRPCTPRSGRRRRR